MSNDEVIQSLERDNSNLRAFMVNLMCRMEDEANDFQSREENDPLTAIVGRAEGTFRMLAGSIRRELFPEPKP